MKVAFFTCTFDPLSSKSQGDKNEVLKKFIANLETIPTNATVTYLQSSGTDFDALKVTLTAIVTTP